MFSLFWQVWIGQIGKKDYQNVKIIKKNSKRWNLWRILDFKCLYFFKEHSMIFQNSLIKSLIHKIKKIKFSRIIWQVQIEEIENKMYKIKKKQKKKKKDVKNTKKLKKQIKNDGILKMFCI